MKIRIQARLNRGGPYHSAILTNEHPDSSHGLPLVVVDGETFARRPDEVYCIRISDFEYAELVRRAGYSLDFAPKR